MDTKLGGKNTVIPLIMVKMSYFSKLYQKIYLLLASLPHDLGRICVHEGP